MSRYDRWTKNDGESLKKLKGTSLFKDYLAKDIRSGKVFPAIRGGKIDFYHFGRKLFSFNGREFRTNVAYLVGFQDRPNGEVSEKAFKKLKLCSSFENGYPQIKDNTKRYSDPESKQVADLWNNHSCCLNELRRFSVLDIELSLTATVSDRSSDRIDLILFDSESKEIRCFEVKTFKNKELRKKAGRVPVVDQIARYRKQIEKRREELLACYAQYVEIVNMLCDLRIPKPRSISERVDLVVFEFNTPQGTQLKRDFVPTFGEDFKCHAIGEASRANQRTLNSWWT